MAVGWGIPTGKMGQSGESFRSLQVQTGGGLGLKGFIMINVEPGAGKAVHDALESIRGIREVVPDYGERDFIAIVDVDSISDPNRAVLAVREIGGVTYTQTILGMELKF